MSVKIHTFEQGTPEWHSARLGIPTASMFDAIIARKRDGSYTDARERYLYTLAGQRITGKIVATYSGGPLERGKLMEDEARRFYVFQSDQKVEKVGLVTNDAWDAAASPDSLVGTDGLLEIKTKEPHILFKCLVTDKVPEEHIAQCQGQLGITGRKWVDFTAYWPDMPKFIKRIQRDRKYIARLKIEVADFNAELDELVRKFTPKAA